MWKMLDLRVKGQPNSFITETEQQKNLFLEQPKINPEAAKNEEENAAGWNAGWNFQSVTAWIISVRRGSGSGLIFRSSSSNLIAIRVISISSSVTRQNKGWQPLQKTPSCCKVTAERILSS